ncbi:glycosyltransferase family 4 protein [Methylobacterium sp. A54F]
MRPFFPHEAAPRGPDAEAAASGLADDPVDMRILLTTEAADTVWPVTLPLAAGLAERGAVVTLAVLGAAPDPARWAEAAAHPRVNLLFLGQPSERTARSAVAVRETSDALAALAWRLDVDLVHLHGAGLLASGGFPVPTLATCHGCVATLWQATETGPLPDDLAWRRDLTGEGLRRADRLIAPTRAAARATMAAYGLTREPAVVHHGLGPRSYLNPRDGAPYVLSAATTWDRADGSRDLEAVAEGLPVPVCASGPLPGGAARPGSVEPLGPLSPEELARRLDQRPIYAALARHAAFGLPVLEAAAAGCALVLSDIPAHRELWADAALLVPAGAPDAARDAVVRLLADRKLRRGLGEAARTRAGSYGVPAMVAGMLAQYQTLRATRPGSVAA